MKLFVFNEGCADRKTYDEDFIKKYNLIFYHDKARKIRSVSKTDYEYTSETAFKEGIEKLKDKPKYILGIDDCFLVTTDENLGRFFAKEKYAYINDNEVCNLAKKCEHILTAKLDNEYIDLPIHPSQMKFKHMRFDIILGSNDKNKLLDCLTKIVTYQRLWDKQFGGRIGTIDSFFDANLSSYGIKPNNIHLDSLFGSHYERTIIKNVDSCIIDAYNKRDYYDNYILKNLLTEEEFECHERRFE